MGRKETGIVSLIAVFVFVFYGLPNALETFQSNLNIVDRLVEISKTLSYPYDVYAAASIFVVLGYTFRRFKKQTDV